MIEDEGISSCTLDATSSPSKMANGILFWKLFKYLLEES